MPTKDTRIDAYINKARPFARPILKHIRKVVHTACPEVEETMKWSMPHFDYKGQMMCAMASFKEHCVFGFWKAKLLKDPKGFLQKRSADGGAAMGNMGRIDNKKSLPPDSVLINLIRQAMKLNDKGIKTPAKPKKEMKPLIIPPYFLKEVKKNTKAQATFNAFSYSNKKEYVEWVKEAKTEETRASRLSTAVEWMSEGKARNWKYVKK